VNAPLELGAVQRDDALLDRIGQRQQDGDRTDLVTALLVGWRTDITDGDAPLEVAAPDTSEGTETASAPADPPTAGASGRRRSARPLILGVGLVVVLLSATGVAAARATPGSVLWPVTKVVASRHAHSVMAREHVLESLAAARKQAGRGNAAAARASLDEATDRVDEVQPGDGKSNLQSRLADLEKMLDGSGAVTAPPQDGNPGPTPQPVDPSTAASPSPSDTPETSPTPAPPPEPTPSPVPSPADPSLAPTPAPDATG
jgi:hypothetical protein